MHSNSIKALRSCIVLTLALYILMLIWLGAEFENSIDSIFQKNRQQANIIKPIYLIVTAITTAWFVNSFRKTKPGRDSEARVLGFLGIVLLVPHIGVTLIWLIGF